MEQPLVTVIIPNYNHSAYLRQRIDSVLAQDYSNYEVVILDDFSTDNSRDIIKEYENRKHIAQLVFNEKNTGSTFQQWNRGLGRAKGKYVWIAESDDVADTSLLSTLVYNLEQYPDSSVAYCHSRLIDAEGNVLSEHNKYNPAPIGKVTVYRSDKFLRRLLIFNYIYNASMAVFRREALASVNEDYMKYRYCGDWHFWASICATGSVIEVHDMLNSFRQHPNKVTEQSKNNTSIRWQHELSTIAYISSLCHLNSLQRVCLRGRLVKRLRKAEMSQLDKERLRLQFGTLCRGGFGSIVCYEVGKNLFGFLRHRENMKFLSQFFK